MSKTTASIPIPRIMHNRGVKILVIGAGQVGSTIVEALHGEHDVTVIDLDQASPAPSPIDTTSSPSKPTAPAGALQDAGIANADLVIACTSRDEANIVAAMLARALGAKTIVRTMNVEYLDIWRERQLDVDFVVASEVETANAIARIIGMPAAKQTDIFADGQVEIVEFDVPDDCPWTRRSAGRYASTDPCRLESRERDPRGQPAGGSRRRGDQARRPRDRHRVADVRARVERHPVARRRAGRRRGRVRRRAHRSRRRAHAAPGASACASSSRTPRRRVSSPRISRRCACSTRPGSTRTFSSASGSARPARRSSPWATMPRTSTRPR